MPYLEYQLLVEDDANFLGVAEEDGYYRVKVDESESELIQELEKLKTIILGGDLKDWKFRGIDALVFDRHLYQPLLYLDQKVVEISPVPLNKGEKIFFEDLRSFYNSNKKYFEDKELYLLRNLSKGKGVGFFEAGNFYPDFILWLLHNDTQHIVFIDPKGIRNLPKTDPKISFFETIKSIENRLSDKTISLNSFIISNTPSYEMEKMWSLEKPEMESMNILFQEEDKDYYVRSMFERIPH